MERQELRSQFVIDELSPEAQALCLSKEPFRACDELGLLRMQNNGQLGREQRQCVLVAERRSRGSRRSGERRLEAARLGVWPLGGCIAL